MVFVNIRGRFCTRAISILHWEPGWGHQAGDWGCQAGGCWPRPRGAWHCRGGGGGGWPLLRLLQAVDPQPSGVDNICCHNTMFFGQIQSYFFLNWMHLCISLSTFLCAYQIFCNTQLFIACCGQWISNCDICMDNKNICGAGGDWCWCGHVLQIPADPQPVISPSAYHAPSG